MHMKGHATRHIFLITHFHRRTQPGAYFSKKRGKEKRKNLQNSSILTYSKRTFFYILLRDYMILAKFFLSHSFINRF